MALEEKPDLVLLDIELPRINGITVCAELRRLHFPNPILMLSSRKEVAHRVKGLNTGADDYLPKPFDGREFLARIKALLRRRQRDERKNFILRFGEVRVDLEKRTARRGAAPLKLTKTEFALLELRAKTPANRSRANRSWTRFGATPISPPRAPWTLTSIA
jgi:two-component system response regulator MprA